MATLTFKLKTYTDSGVMGLVRTLTENGYGVRFRKGNCTKLMVDVTDDDALIREWDMQKGEDDGNHNS